MTFAPIPLNVAKTRAFEKLASAAGISDANPYSDRVPQTLDAIRRIIAPVANGGITSSPAEQTPGVSVHCSYHSSTHRRSPPLSYLNGPPKMFPEANKWFGVEPDYRIISIAEGFLLLAPDAPIILSGSRQIVEPFGSKFRGLLHYYDFDANSVLDRAIRVDGTAIVIVDDVWTLNYCHWLCDWLPRLAGGGRSVVDDDVYVVTSPLTATFQRESLHAAGFSDDRILPIPENSALTAKRLLVPSNLGVIHHPACKGSNWSLNFLRSSIGLTCLSQTAVLDQNAARKLYVSRKDASGRRIKNEDELVAVLRKFGYQDIDLGKMPIASQIKFFSCADNIISMHGAALANLVFAHTGARVVEIFPSTYGTPAYAIIAARLGIHYAAYVEDNILAGPRAQLDDVYLDVDEFLTRCQEWL